MDLNDEIRIAAPRELVYASLNNPKVLRRCIPGCEELVQHSPQELEARVVLRIGPLKARFAGTVRLDNSNAPDGFNLTGEGKGGAAGFAKGGADVTLQEDGSDTILRYSARVEIGGKIAQLGSRLIAGAAKKLSARFFANLAEILEEMAV